MLSQEQISQIKLQLIDHISKSFPEEKKQEAISSVQEMTGEELEDFIVKNNLIKGQGNGCIFCSIISGNSPSFKISENQEALAVLEINPISKGHILIIPKEHIPTHEGLPEGAKELAKKMTELLKEKFKPKKVEAASQNLFGHQIINILPIYSEESFQSKRNPANKEELEELEKTLKEDIKTPEKKEEKKPKKNKTIRKPRVKKIKAKDLWLPQRIP